MEPVEIPQVTETTTPAEAKAALDKIHAAAACNVEHPYSNPRHPQHRAMLDATAALHAIHATREDAELSPMELAMREGLARQDAKKDMLAQDIEDEIAKLHDLGFEGEGPTGDPAPHHLVGLRMQRLHAQGDLDALTPMLENELRSLKASGETMALFRSFADADVDPELRSDVMEKLIRWAHAAQVARAAGKPKPSTPDMENQE